MANIEDLIGDTNEQENGKWLKFPENAEIEFLIVYSRKGKPRNFFQKKLNKMRDGRGTVAAEKAHSATIDMLVEQVIKDWKGLTTKDPADATKRVPFEFNKVNCRRLLEDAVPLLDWIAGACGDIENFGGKLDGTSNEDEEDTANAKMKSEPSLAT